MRTIPLLTAVPFLFTVPALAQSTTFDCSKNPVTTCKPATQNPLSRLSGVPTPRRSFAYTCIPSSSGIYVSRTCPSGATDCYEAFIDGQFVTDATFTASSSTVLTSDSDPPFLCPGSVYPCSAVGPESDVGKIVFGTYFCGDDTAVPCFYDLPQSTILTVNGAHSITVFTRARNSSVKGTNSVLVWGHDDGATIKRAIAAVVANRASGPSSALQLPCGTMLTSLPPFIVPSTGATAVGVSGCGGGGTMIIPLPKMNCTGGAGRGCLIDDGQHVESSGQVQPSAHFRDIVFYGGGTDVKDPSATVDANTAGIAISFFDELENVWVVGWLWNSATPNPGISNSGGAMINSGSYAGGTPSCILQGSVATVATMLAGSCGGSQGDSLTFGAGSAGVATYGVYVNQSRGAYGAKNDSALWSDYGSIITTSFLSQKGGTTYLDGSQLHQFGGGNSALTIQGGTVTLCGVNFFATGAPINMTAGKLFDACKNTLTGTTPVFKGGEVFGDASITGTSASPSNFRFGAGFGESASMSSVMGNTKKVRGTITASGTGQSPNPTMTYTFPTQFWRIPVCTIKQDGGTQETVALPFTVEVPTLTSVSFIYQGTIGAGKTLSVVIECGNP